MELMKKKLQKIYRNLTIQWLVVACLIILPVNVLTVVITRTVAKSYEEKIRNSYVSQLKIYTNSVDAEFGYMQNLMTEFLCIENLEILMRGSDTDSTVQVARFKEDLGVNRNWISFSGYSFVWDREKDIVSFFQQKKQYPLELKNDLEECLRQQEAEMSGNKNDRLFQLDGYSFLINQYRFPYFSVGMMYDVGEILRNFCNSGAQAGGTVYLADREGGLISAYGEEGFLAKTEMKRVDQLKADAQNVVLEQPFKGGQYNLVQVITRKDILRTLPSLIQVLYVLTILGFIAVPVLFLFAMRMILRPLVKLCKAMEEVENGNLKYHVEGKTSNYQTDYLYCCFNRMVDELNRLVISSYEREIEKLQGDAINMRLQVNQHMLLNFLNTIYSLAQVGKMEQVSEFTLLLMKYFRYVLRQNIALVTIQEEMQFVEDYLKIQKIRFPDSFICVYQIDEDAEKISIPQLLIENFVENSIKYGIVMGSEIEILINVHIVDQKVSISICDTGNGMPERTVEQLMRGEIIEDRAGKHIGIWNCRRRMKYYYGEEYELRITSKPGEGTQVWMEFPLEPLETDEAAQTVRKLENRLNSGVREQVTVMEVNDHENIDCG